MPTIDIPDKICPHCGGTKWYVGPATNRHICSIRLKEQSRKKYLKYKEKYIEYEKKYREKHKDDPIYKQKKLVSDNRWGKRHPEKRKEYKRKCNLKLRNFLKDEYVKRQIIQYTDLKFSDIPPELVELKRKQIQLYRRLKQNGSS